MKKRKKLVVYGWVHNLWTPQLLRKWLASKMHGEKNIHKVRITIEEI
jgi:hypothetical protein